MIDIVKKDPIAIIAGRGNLPKMLIEECQARSQEFKIFLLDGENYENDYSSYNPITLKYGEIGKLIGLLDDLDIKNILFIGAVNKPNFSKIKVDKTTAVLVAKILANKVLGDDAVLRTVVKFFEKKGFNILSIDQLMDCMVSKKQTLTKLKPSKENLDDIAIGKKAIKSFSKHDVGQALVVAQKQIIAVEAVEGTDSMIKRCGDLEVDYKKQATLIKLKKSGQSRKADLPTIGLDTIKSAAEAGIKGIAIQKNSTLILQKEEVINLADKLKLFITVI